MNDEILLIHYWQLPEDLFVSLKDNFHKRFCLKIKEKTNYNFKNCFHRILYCPKWHAQRLFTKYTRFTIKELEVLRKFAEISEQEVEKEIESLGNHEDGAIIKNPNLPFHSKDIFYVASHLIFDGSFRFKHGCYFYAYEDSLVEYHKKRLLAFGEVPINLIKRENHLYFSYTIGYIVSKVLDIETFKSTKCYLSKRFKELAKENKILVDEVVKALIIDEGAVEDKIEVELSNKQLVEDLYEIINFYYELTKITTRTREFCFKLNPKWIYISNVWKIGFSASSFKNLFLSISPLPIDYKQENLEFLYKVKTCGWKQRKHHGETRRLIVLSLLNKPKTLSELAKELCMKQTTISAYIKKLPVITKVNEKILRRGGYSRVNVFGIRDISNAQEFLSK